MTVTTFFLVILLRGNRPPVPTCQSFLKGKSWLSSASRSRRRSGYVQPFRPLTLYRIAVGAHTPTDFVQRGSVCI